MTRYLGRERKMGTYEGNDYDNMVLHFQTDEKPRGWIEGDMTFSLKVKSAMLDEVLMKDVEPGAAVVIQYNRYGQPELIALATPKK